jgi:nitrogen fixation protein
MKVKVKIIETLERVVCVEAKDKNEGIVKVATDYTDGKITLDENNLVSFKIERYESK